MIRLFNDKKLYTEAAHCFFSVHNRTMTKSSYEAVRHMTHYQIICAGVSQTLPLAHVWYQIKSTRAKEVSQRKNRLMTCDEPCVRDPPVNSYRCCILGLKRVLKATMSHLTKSSTLEPTLLHLKLMLLNIITKPLKIGSMTQEMM